MGRGTGDLYMRREDLSVSAIFLEAIEIIFGIIYIGLQIYYGLYYHITPYKFIMNLLAMILVYLGLSLLSCYPERINNIAPEYCVGKVRKYSLRMIRLIKFVFVTGLLVPCVCDAIGYEILSVYSFIVIGIILVIAVYYESKIIKEIKNMHK